MLWHTDTTFKGGLLMATITPALSIVDGVPRITWTGVSTADTMVSWKVQEQRALAGAVQFKSTFGSSTVKLQASNDDTTFADMKDVNGTAISATAAAFFEFSTAAGYLKPASSGGTADNVDVVMILRG